MNRLTAAFVCACLLFATPARAGYGCAALDQEDSYKSKKGYLKIIEGSDGSFFRSKADLKKDFDLSPAMAAYFKRFNDDLKEKGIDLVMVTPPTRAMMMAGSLTPSQIKEFGYDADKAFADYLGYLDALRDTGIKVADYADIKHPQDHYFYKRDHHWTWEGAKDSAARAAAVIKTLDSYQDLQKIEFATTENGKREIKGSFSDFVRDTCKSTIPGEDAGKFDTAPKSSASDADALLGDAAKPGIVIVGTSNCTDESSANFPGWVKESVGADVDNQSIGGGGIDTPILSYLLDTPFREGGHKILIWEVASHYKIGGAFEDIFRQAIPAIEGGCKGSEIATQTIKTSELAKTDLFKGEIDAKDGVYLHLAFDAPLSGKPVVKTVYADKKSDSFSFDRDKRFRASGEYFLMLDQRAPGDIDHLNIRLPAKGADAASVTASLCPMKSIATFASEGDAAAASDEKPGLIQKLFGR